MTPSEGLGDNRVIGAEGTPVSQTLVQNEWDDPIRAIDGKCYYGTHFSGKDLPYEYDFPQSYLTDGWKMVENHISTGPYNGSGGICFSFSPDEK